MDEMNVVDVSSFMLLEATGDSEVDSELNMDVAADHGADDDDDDDAQSCSCDLLDYCGPEFDYDHLGHAHDQDLHFDHDDHFDDDEDEGEVIDQDWTHDDNDDDDDQVGLSSTAKAGLHKKSSVDSNMELMNEMEKNRLFWEACLAS